MKETKQEKQLRKEAEKEAKKAQTNKAEYKIVLLEKLGGTVRAIKTFYAYRWLDTEDHVVYLKNDSLKFMEIFPQQINDFKNYSPGEVQGLINKYQHKLETERTIDSADVNDKDIEFELLKLKAKMRSFKFDPNASYLSFDEHSRPTFHYLREGSSFHPFKIDTDTKTIFTPSDNRKKSASIALRNKESKYNTKKLIEGGTILLLLLGFVFFGTGGYFWYKANSSANAAFNNYDQSHIAAAQRASLETANQCAKITTEIAGASLNIFNSLEGKLNQNQTIISGLTPE